jgi:hypothetical protein
MASGIFPARQKRGGGSGVLSLFAPALRTAVVKPRQALVQYPRFARRIANPWMNAMRGIGFETESIRPVAALQAARGLVGCVPGPSARAITERAFSPEFLAGGV